MNIYKKINSDLYKDINPLTLKEVKEISDKYENT